MNTAERPLLKSAAKSFALTEELAEPFCWSSVATVRNASANSSELMASAVSGPLSISAPAGVAARAALNMRMEPWPEP